MGKYPEEELKTYPSPELKKLWQEVAAKGQVVGWVLEKETWHMPNGMLLHNVHSKTGCEGPCIIHSPTDHKMRKWPVKHLPAHKGEFHFARICGHGNLHPDPDEAAYLGTPDHMCYCNCCCDAYDF